MSTLANIVSRIWDHFVDRSGGPLHFRFLLQPTMATIAAVRAGLRDARAAHPPFLWALVTRPDQRASLLRECVKHVSLIFLLAVVLDGTYQIVVHGSVTLREALFVATVLAVLPYALLRGPVNRLARWFSLRAAQSPHVIEADASAAGSANAPSKEGADDDTPARPSA